MKGRTIVTLEKVEENKPGVLKWQIRLIERDGCGSFLYFDATPEEAKQKACEVANEDLAKSYKNDEHNLWFQPRFKPIRTVSVVEYDRNTHSAKRKGKKFKLRLSYFLIKFRDGSQVKNEWYEVL